MPNPTEICKVVAQGMNYDYWETVEVTHSCAEIVDHAMLTVSEPSTGAASLAALKLKPGDSAQVYLAGTLIIDGHVYLRQAAYDANSHGVQIGIVSNVQGALVSTVSAAPGQYINSTLQQIASTVMGEIGVKFSIDGSPSGANEPFDRVSEHVGETRFEFINRLCRMRNLHLVDDGQNGLMAFRGSNAGGLVLAEGQNILKARLLLKNNESVSDIIGLANNHNQDAADANRNPKAEVSGSSSVSNRPLKFVAEEPSSAQLLQHRVNHELDYIKYQEIDGDITTSGWFAPDGALWWTHLRDQITINSPMLIPNGSDTFMIKGVTHRQSTADGTTTEVLICDSAGLGSGDAPAILGQ